MYVRTYMGNPEKVNIITGVARYQSQKLKNEVNRMQKYVQKLQHTILNQRPETQVNVLNSTQSPSITSPDWCKDSEYVSFRLNIFCIWQTKVNPRSFLLFVMFCLCSFFFLFFFPLLVQDCPSCPLVCGDGGIGRPFIFAILVAL